MNYGSAVAGAQPPTLVLAQFVILARAFSVAANPIEVTPG